MAELSFRKANIEDTPLILSFIRSLAEYEQMGNQVVATVDLLEEEIFTKHGAEVLLALEDGVEILGTTVRIAKEKDLFVTPEHRGKGYGKALLQQLALIARSRGCGRMEWWCLDWNKPSIDFYLSVGAEPMSNWTVYRLSGETLAALADS